MTRFVVYLATSVDGCIASPDGSFEWLHPYPAEEYGYAEFVAGVDSVIMGRTSFDQALGFGPWAYGGLRTIVLSSRPLPADAPAGVESWSGDLRDLGDDIRRREGKDVWIYGGGKTVRAFLDAGLVDQFDLYVIPVLLGQGLPLFPPGRGPIRLALAQADSLPRGVVRLVYDRKS